MQVFRNWNGPKAIAIGMGKIVHLPPNALPPAGPVIESPARLPGARRGKRQAPVSGRALACGVKPSPAATGALATQNGSISPKMLHQDF
jgi:hypothetical protein